MARTGMSGRRLPPRPKGPATVTFSRELMIQIDLRRGREPRRDYVERLLREQWGLREFEQPRRRDRHSDNEAFFGAPTTGGSR
jgi:hypothetical protein